MRVVRNLPVTQHGVAVVAQLKDPGLNVDRHPRPEVLLTGMSKTCRGFALSVLWANRCLV